MQASELLQSLAVLVECAVAIIGIVIATRNRKQYGWFIAITFALFVLFDIFRIFAQPIPDLVHAVIFFIACASMLYAVWLIANER